MAISKARKEELVAQYIDLLGKSQAVFLTDYTGMDVKAMESLRDKVYEAEGAFHVTKNTLLRYALQQAEMPVPEEFLNGQVATGFAMGEVPSLAKALVDFADDEDNLELRGAIMSGELLSLEDVEALAKLPSLDQLRAQIIGLIDGPARNLASVMASGVRQVVNVIDAYAKSEEEEAAEAAA